VNDEKQLSSKQQDEEGYMRIPPSRLYLLTYALDFDNKQNSPERQRAVDQWLPPPMLLPMA